VPFAAAFAGGVIAFRARRDNLAARRLLAFGAVSLAWMAGTFALVLAYDAHGEGGWLVVPNLVVQVLGLALVAAIVALLAVYPDGVYQRHVDARIVRALFGLAVAVPALLLFASREIEPAWIFEWLAETGSLPPVEGVESPLYVGAFAWLAPLLAGFMEASLGVVPLIGVVLAVRRYRHFGPERRLQMKWPVAGAIPLAVLPLLDILVAAGALPVAAGDAVELLALMVMPAALVIGLVRPQLFDIEGFVRRAIVLWGSPASPSFPKIALTCFSTADSDRTSASAIPPFVLPRAISRMTSSSRGVSSSSPELARRLRRSSSASTTRVSSAERPARTSPSARSSSSRSPMRSFSRLGEPSGPVFEQSERIALVRVLRQDHDPD
jgi:hypothetical protein